ncbi:nitroreductase family deazaflavin-dependent oxidoreductase [Streptomyces sp. CT34]|uniref:nitroreductase family deazaflavin-dependent oxidoreductase n=1 Tax=Streptomyces sp. CT34 TaxID=1553907 RepID=UPI000690B635|nr:nitroreductase family deazaflavin-dependent oxidoreductase [Streptomyces sp. CT34]
MADGMTGERTRPVHPLISRIGRTRLFSRLAPRLLPVCDRLAHRATRGHWMPSHLFLPTILLTTRHPHGHAHATPVCAYRYPDGSWLVIASNFGRPHHPLWSDNLLRHPSATVTSDGRDHPVTARLLTPAETQAERPGILAALPVYDHYAARAKGRPLRVFRLTPSA